MINGASSANGRHAAACSRGRRSNRAAGYTSRPLAQKRELCMLGFSVIASWKIIHTPQSHHQRSAKTTVVVFSAKDEHDAPLHKVFIPQMDWFVDSSAAIWWIVKVIFGGRNVPNMFQPLQWEDFLLPLLCFYIIVNWISLSFGLFLGRKRRHNHNHPQRDCDWCSLPFSGIS